MPIYAYKCDSCGHSLEVLQKMSDPPARDCPACGQPSLTKQVTAAGFQLKGSGWYVTDFRGGQSAAPAADKADDKGADKPSDKATEKPSDPSPTPSSAAAVGMGASEKPAPVSAAPATAGTGAADAKPKIASKPGPAAG